MKDMMIQVSDETGAAIEEAAGMLNVKPGELLEGIFARYIVERKRSHRPIPAPEFIRTNGRLRRGGALMEYLDKFFEINKGKR